ncbi:CocE/NonD family hydrolase (plasmid) [Haloferax sp. S1W]|uniref:CocE/NonD family hydrolase n=1 Tax=Haloferax sp. S1W TaxID=3377110 RepID=UPI0037C9217B
MTAPDTLTDEAMRIDYELTIPVEDTTVHATRYEPAHGAAPRPVVLTFTPYHKDDLSCGPDRLISSLVEHGYDVVVADLVGTGASPGLASEPFSPAEGIHGATVVEWLAAREWCTGAVGVIGKSYPGTTALEIAAENPDGLETIVPIHAPTRIYDSYFDGGALALLRTCGLWAPNFEYLPAQPPAHRGGDGQWATTWDDRLEALADRKPYLFQYLSHSTKDEYWARKDVPIDQITTPTLAVGGYQDAFAESTIEYASETDAPTRLILGPWRHTLPEDGETGQIDFVGEVAAWFDTYLRDGDTTNEIPPVRHWTATPTESDPLAGCWRGRDRWPQAVPGVDADDCTSFVVSKDGLTTERPESPLIETWGTDFGVGVNSIGFEIPDGTSLDTTPDDIRSLTYETAALSSPFELTGSGSVQLTVVPEGHDQLVAVRLVDVAPDESAQLVTHGVIRASMAHDEIDPTGHYGAVPEPLTQGEPVTVEVSLRPTSHVFKPSHQLRLAVSGAFFPYVLPPAESGEFELHSTADAPSVCVLPGGFRDDCSFSDDYSFAPPQPDESNPVASVDWETTENHSNDVVSVALSQAYEKVLPWATFGYEMNVDARTHRDDPASATVKRVTTTTLTYPTETVVTCVETTMSVDVATATYHVTVDGTTVFEDHKRWTPGPNEDNRL